MNQEAALIRSLDGKVDPRTLNELWARAVYNVASTIPSLAGHGAGGHYLLWDANAAVSLIELGNDPDRERRGRTSSLVFEKVSRLRRNSQMTSWESRDPENQEWGGGVSIGRFGDRLFYSGTSGLNEEGDGIVSTVAPLMAKLLDHQRAQEIVKRSELKTFAQVMEMLQ